MIGFTAFHLFHFHSCSAYFSLMHAIQQSCTRRHSLLSHLQNLEFIISLPLQACSPSPPIPPQNPFNHRVPPTCNNLLSYPRPASLPIGSINEPTMTLSASATAPSLCRTLSCGSRVGLRNWHQQPAVRTGASSPYRHGTCGVGDGLRR